jgi:hypothetical protein
VDAGYSEICSARVAKEARVDRVIIAKAPLRNEGYGDQRSLSTARPERYNREYRRNYSFLRF